MLCFVMVCRGYACGDVSLRGLRRLLCLTCAVQKTRVCRAVPDSQRRSSNGSQPVPLRCHPVLPRTSRGRSAGGSYQGILHCRNCVSLEGPWGDKRLTSAVCQVTVGIKRPVEMAQLPATGNASKRRKASTRFQTEESLISHRLDSTKRHLPTQVNAVLGIRQGDCRVCSLAGYRSKTTKACSECQEPLCGQTKKRDNHIAPCWTIWCVISLGMHGCGGPRVYTLLRHQHKDMIHAIRSQPEYFKSGVRRGAEQLV